MKYFQRGGGYYIDVGCSQLIIDGKIKVKQGQEIEEVKPHGLLFADGAELPADEIVFATGYENMRGTAGKIFGPELAERVNVHLLQSPICSALLNANRMFGASMTRASLERCGGKRAMKPDTGGIDDQLTNLRRTGHPGFWFFGGNLALCRYFSRMLALQIKAMEVGLMKHEDP